MKSILEVGTSSVVFRLNKVSKFGDPYYIFEMINQNSKEKVLFTGDDISPAPLIYNEFEWVNGVTFSATQSRFNLDPGNYFLNIYETEYQYDLNLGSASILYHNEIKIIDDGECPPIVSFDETDNDTFVYFDCDYESIIPGPTGGTGGTGSTIEDLNLIVYESLEEFEVLTDTTNGNNVYLWSYDVSPFLPPSWNPDVYTFTVPNNSGGFDTITSSDNFIEWNAEGLGNYILSVTAENETSNGTGTYSFLII